jgi:hypothetical protein
MMISTGKGEWRWYGIDLSESDGVKWKATVKTVTNLRFP